jgi:hypothetical protein
MNLKHIGGSIMFSKSELIDIETSISCNINKTKERIYDLKEENDYWESSNNEDKEVYIRDTNDQLLEENKYLSDLMQLKTKVKYLRAVE